MDDTVILASGYVSHKISPLFCFTSNELPCIFYWMHVSILFFITHVLRLVLNTKTCSLACSAKITHVLPKGGDGFEASKLLYSPITNQ